VLLDKKTLDGIAAGDIRLAFRRWTRPTVKTGGTLRTRIGVLRITEVRRISAREITPTDAKLAGFATKKALMERLAKRADGALYRVAFEPGGTDPRVALREDDDLTDEDVSRIAQRLARMGPWTTQTLELIERNPGVRAADLAPQLQQERLPFKANVRKLKALGLTISLERGYRLSPRGAAYLRTRARPAPPA
jgi:hypothetical protein